MSSKKDFGIVSNFIRSAISKDESRPALTMISRYDRGEDIYIVSTDGFRLHLEKMDEGGLLVNVMEVGKAYDPNTLQEHDGKYPDVSSIVDAVLDSRQDSWTEHEPIQLSVTASRNLFKENLTVALHAESAPISDDKLVSADAAKDAELKEKRAALEESRGKFHSILKVSPNVRQIAGDIDVDTMPLVALNPEFYASALGVAYAKNSRIDVLARGPMQPVAFQDVQQQRMAIVMPMHRR